MLLYFNLNFSQRSKQTAAIMIKYGSWSAFIQQLISSRLIYGRMRLIIRKIHRQQSHDNGLMELGIG